MVRQKDRAKGGSVADNSVAYVAIYDDVNSALADLDVLGELLAQGAGGYRAVESCLTRAAQ